MFNKEYIIRLVNIIILALLQVFVFNHINFLQSYEPYVYIIFVIFYPPKLNRYILLFLAFFLGLLIDTLEYTGGIHTFALTFTAYIRVPIIKILVGKQEYEMESFSFNLLSFVQWIIYIVILVFLHNITLFILENFKLESFSQLAIKALFNSALTIIFILIYKILFQKNIEI